MKKMEAKEPNEFSDNLQIHNTNKFLGHRYTKNNM